MACNFNLDDLALERPTVGLMQPISILVVAEDAVEPVEDEDAVVNLHLPQQPRPVQPQEPRNTEDSSMESVMAHAKDLRDFQEYEGYLYNAADSGSDTDVPEDDSDDDEADVEAD